MKSICVHILLAGLSLAFISCYTVLDTGSQRNSFSPPLPDLEIIEVKENIYFMRMADSDDQRPRVTYAVKVMNVGSGVFTANFVLGWADDPNDQAAGEFPHTQGVAPREGRIAPGETIEVHTSETQFSYYPGMTVRFVAATQSFMPGAYCRTFFPAAGSFPERDYDNNYFDLVIN